MALDETQKQPPLNESAQENPFDTSKQEQELTAIEAELEQARQSIEGDFAKFAAQSITPEDEDLFFDKREEFFKKVLQMQNDYLESNITPKAERAQTLRGEINNKKTAQGFDKALQEFTQKYPDVNVEELLGVLEQCPPDVIEKLKALPPLQMLETLLAIQKELQGSSQEASASEPTLPKQLQGVSSQSQAGINNLSDLPMNRF